MVMLTIAGARLASLIALVIGWARFHPRVRKQAGLPWYDGMNKAASMDEFNTKPPSTIA
jgi:hypothetical protein